MHLPKSEGITPPIAMHPVTDGECSRLQESDSDQPPYVALTLDSYGGMLVSVEDIDSEETSMQAQQVLQSATEEREVTSHRYVLQRVEGVTKLEGWLAVIGIFLCLAGLGISVSSSFYSNHTVLGIGLALEVLGILILLTFTASICCRNFPRSQTHQQSITSPVLGAWDMDGLQENMAPIEYEAVDQYEYLLGYMQLVNSIPQESVPNERTPLLHPQNNN